MGKNSHVRIEVKPVYGIPTPEMKDRALRWAMATFKRKVNEMGILTEYSRKQAFESEGQKLRRKRKESELRRRKESSLQSRLRENFG